MDGPTRGRGTSSAGGSPTSDARCASRACMDDDRDLREAFAAASRAAAPPHLDDGEWERLAAGEMGAAERERALDHVTRCAACAPICKALLMLEEEARAADPRIRSSGLARPARNTVALRWLGGFAAAAAAAAWAVLAPLTPRRAPQ